MIGGLTKFLFAATLALASMSAQAQSSDWIFFDLGEVIVTGNPTTGYQFVAGAVPYLQELRQRGYKTALITNIPQAWGAACSVKFDALRDFLGSRLHEPQPMPWQLFDAIVLPPFDRYRKPHQYMFLRALSQACPGRAMFVGENDAEVNAAEDIGFATYRGEDGALPYPSADQVDSIMAAGFRYAHPERCDYGSRIDAVLTPPDVAGSIAGCILAP